MTIRHTSGFAAAMSTLLASYVGMTGTAHGQEFFYNGDSGPGFWSELNPDWSACAGDAADARQSPINIRNVRKVKSLKKLELATYPTTIDLINNGHTIEQHYEGTGSSILFEGRQYELTQFHFHTLSEHEIDGHRAKMEMHGVYSDESTGDKLVIGTLFGIGANANSFLQTLIDAGLPEKSGDSTVSGTPINFEDGLTSKHSYYAYPGSLTTPPCTENVTWIVLKRTARMTSTQFDEFRRLLGNDFRPLQNRNGRVVHATVN